MTWLWVLGFLALLFGAVFISTAGRNLADVIVSPTGVTIAPRGMNKFWSFKRRISIPFTSIRSAVVTSGLRNLPKGIRLPGTAIPGIILAGTYVRKRERSFYVLRDGKEIVLLELEDHVYRRVAVQTRDPHGTVATINQLSPRRSEKNG